jgi:hypothetical protein
VFFQLWGESLDKLNQTKDKPLRKKISKGIKIAVYDLPEIFNSYPDIEAMLIRL